MLPAPTLLMLERITSGFFAEDSSPVFAAVCCSRLYVGREPATSCRTCPQVPTSVKISAHDILSEVVAPLLG